MYRPPGSTGPIVGGVGGLAATGADFAWWIAFGIVLLVAGMLSLRMARRRDRAVQGR